MTEVVVFKNSGRLRLYLELFGGKCQVSAAVLPHITETSWKCSAPTEVTESPEEPSGGFLLILYEAE